MGKFTDAIHSRRKQKRLFEETDQDLRERILNTGKREIIPRLHEEYKECVLKDAGVNLANGYRLQIIENKRGELELEIDILAENLDSYMKINTSLSTFYEKIREEYGVNISFYLPEFDFF